MVRSAILVTALAGLLSAGCKDSTSCGPFGSAYCEGNLLSTCVDDGMMGRVDHHDCAADGLVCASGFSAVETGRAACLPAACTNPCFTVGDMQCSLLFTVDRCAPSTHGDCNEWQTLTDCRAMGGTCDIHRSTPACMGTPTDGGRAD